MKIKRTHGTPVTGRMISILALGLVILFQGGCTRGRPKTKPPIHLNPNMDSQQKFKPYQANPLFSDGTTMRQPVIGTVARGDLLLKTPFYTGKNADGTFVEKSLLPVTRETLERGQERFNIYCSVCHGRLGDGQGIITRYKYPLPPTSFHSDRLRDLPDGYFFDVITHGIRNMPAYRHQIPAKDRWAIVNYLRALQYSQNAHIEDIPEDIRAILTP